MNAMKICVVTGSRAEYDLLFNLISQIQSDSGFQLQLVVTGMHLSPEFGLTIHHIEQDGFVIDEKVYMLLSSDEPVGVAKSLGLGVLGFSDAFSRLQPDAIVVLGDRFEILAAAQVATILQIPLVHIHGGEVTEGAYDDAIRHAITKMAQVHLVAAEDYRKRVVQMGEDPSSVFNVGAPGLENLKNLDKMSLHDLEDALETDLSRPFFLVTLHPQTVGLESQTALIDELLMALKEFPEHQVIFTFPNADNGGREIIAAIQAFIAQNIDCAKIFVSLGRKKYLNLMRYATLVLGNSSSGIIEAPFFPIPTIDIGNRQNGRLKASSVISCEALQSDIILAIQKAISAEFQAVLKTTESLYGYGDTSQTIMDILKQKTLGMQKKFFNINHGF
ncbi:MAG TPA: UDP-N-acetylglucosamine 2-epimerase (hydrolyzing) [Legionellales bacterium]|nr:UDP-N-acetylglucosamine 2-epimerase (hydrolyzing) [Legionellales bacterium]